MRKKEKREKRIKLKETNPFVSNKKNVFFFQLNVVIKEANNIIKSLF